MTLQYMTLFNLAELFNLAVYCATLYMDNNVAKTKVMMVVSKPSVRLPPPMAAIFTCNGLAAEHADTFNFLGVHFHTYGSSSLCSS